MPCRRAMALFRTLGITGSDKTAVTQSEYARKNFA
jgi:hypothetical protein